MSPVTVGLECEGSQPRNGTLKDIAAGGIAVLTTVAFPIGTTISVLLPIDERRYRADGVVRHCTTHGLDARGGYVVGIEFISTVPPLSRLRVG